MATTLFVDAVTLSSASWFNDVDSGIYALTAVAGTNTITATGPNSLTAYATGKIAKFIPAATNTGATTINISSLGAKNVFYSGAACVGGELKINVPVQIYYDGTQFNILGANTIYTPSSTTSEDLVSYEHVDLTTAHRDQIKAGYLPAWFNQQWGGGVNYYELVDAATGTAYKFESATGQIQNEVAQGIGLGAANYYGAEGFTPSTSFTLDAVWLKLSKSGNPATITVRIYSNTGNSPNAAIGSAVTMSGKLITSDATGAWYRFSGLAAAVVANTKYHVVTTVSTATGSDYLFWMATTSSKYPGGNYAVGTSVPAWTPSTGNAYAFLVEAPTTTQTFQSGGIFGDGKAVFYEGSPLNQSNQRTANLADLKGLTPNNMTLLLRGTAHTKDKTIADMTYGLDHDRVVLRCAVTTGFPVLTVYDSAGTARTVTGTTDISTGDHDVAALVTSAGCSLWVDGVSQGTPIVATITFDTLFAQGQIGSLWIGGGFALAPTWSGSSISTFSGLPSTLGWTYGGSATEANAFSVSGGKLYENKSGVTALQTAYYSKTTAGLSNANGWNAVVKEQVLSGTNTSQNSINIVDVLDGSKNLLTNVAEYFMQAFSGSWLTSYPQSDFKSTENVLNIAGKGSDGYTFVNGRLLMDATGLVTGATATNQINIGDSAAGSGENTDVRYSYWKYYTTAALLPQATSGSLSEWAIWTGDKTSILATLWNSGSPISVKQFCGLGVNWKRGDDGAFVQRTKQNGITLNSSSTATTLTAIAEMSAFVVGDYADCDLDHTSYSGASSIQTQTAFGLDGLNGLSRTDFTTNANGYTVSTHLKERFKTYFGLHKIEGRLSTASGTNISYTTDRALHIEARS